LISTKTSLLRGLLLRCPYCGRGKLFRRGLAMYDRCLVCGWHFEREEGYWTGAIAVNMAVTALLIVIILVPVAIALATSQIPVLELMIVSLPLPIVLPLLFFRHSKSFWMSFDIMMHPVEPDELR
jgi:uncharacterized protein (DUF983 family)